MNITRMRIGWALGLSIVGAAAMSATAQQPVPGAEQSAKASPPMTIAGCVQSESSVLKRNPVVGNVGMDDEFVLTFATVNPAPGANDAPKPDAAPPQPAGTSGGPGNFGHVYRLTGALEKDLKSYAGQRVEITGTLKEKEKVTDAMSSIGTSGKTELTPANTPELTIDAIKPLGGACTPAIK
jgi:hypothetical protein